jgi:hypothetical protein
MNVFNRERDLGADMSLGFSVKKIVKMTATVLICGLFQQSEALRDLVAASHPASVTVCRRGAGMFSVIYYWYAENMNAVKKHRDFLKSHRGC